MYRRGVVVSWSWNSPKRRFLGQHWGTVRNPLPAMFRTGKCMDSEPKGLHSPYPNPHTEMKPNIEIKPKMMKQTTIFRTGHGSRLATWRQDHPAVSEHEHQNMATSSTPTVSADDIMKERLRMQILHRRRRPKIRNPQQPKWYRDLKKERDGPSRSRRRRSSSPDYRDGLRRLRRIGEVGPYGWRPRDHHRHPHQQARQDHMLAYMGGYNGSWPPPSSFVPSDDDD